MKNKKSLLIVSTFSLIAVMMLSACAPAAAPTTAPAVPVVTAEPTKKPLKFVYVTQQSIGTDWMMVEAEKGLIDVAKEFNAVEKTFESEDITTAELNIRAAVAEGADIILVMFFDIVDVVTRVAPEFPNVKFLYVDQCITPPLPNVYCATFKEHEVAFLLGAEAGLLTKTNKVGGFGPLDFPFFHRFSDGFRMGAEYVNPKIEWQYLFIGGANPFGDPARVKELALTLAADGYDQIFAAGVAGNTGAYEAAKEKGVYIYGANTNECPFAPGYVIDNFLKLTYNVVRDSVTMIMKGTHPPQIEYGVGVKGGEGIVPFDLDNPETSQCLIMKYPEVIAQVGAIRQKIIDGTLKIPDPMLSDKPGDLHVTPQ